MVYGGAPGQFGSYFDKATLDATGGSRTKLWESLQVTSHEKYEFRSKIQAYRVKRDAITGTGQVLAQGPAVFGHSCGAPFFMSNYKIALEPIGFPFNIGV